MTALGQMAPSFAGHYSADLLLGDAKARGKIALADFALEAPNLRDLLAAQFRTAVERAFAGNAEAGAVSVIAVLARRTPFEVVRAVVQLVAVLVIDLVTWRRRATEERIGDQAMDRRKGLGSAQADRCPQIAAPYRPERQDSHSDKPLAASIGHPSIKNSKAAQIGNLVGCLKADHGAPNLFRHPYLQTPDALQCHYQNRVPHTRNKGANR